jgi:UDP-glucose 6-dehydrogenase
VFITKGTAIMDLLNPDRILIGGEETEDGRAAMATLASKSYIHNLAFKILHLRRSKFFIDI